MSLPCEFHVQLLLSADVNPGKPVARFFIVAVLLSAGVAAAKAADVPRGEPLPPSALQQEKASVTSELRFGATIQDPAGPESSSANLTGEILSIRSVLIADPILSLFIPRFHLGGSMNMNGDTSFAYAGPAWAYSITPLIFIEGSFRGAVRKIETSPVDSQHSALGCTALFRDSASLGMKVTENWNVITTVEHLSNAGFCSNNRGPTNWACG